MPSAEVGGQTQTVVMDGPLAFCGQSVGDDFLTPFLKIRRYL